MTSERIMSEKEEGKEERKGSTKGKLVKTEKKKKRS
jgi:hypothetical protein